MNEGPTETVADKAEPKDPVQETLEAYAGVEFADLDFPQDVEGGEPKEPEAVEPSEDADKPTEPEEKSEEAKPEEGEGTKDPEDEGKASESEPKVNFDGFSDESKAFWEKAVESGWATPADVDRARHESMFQSTFTKKTTTLAEERRAFEEEQKAWREQNAEDFGILEKIRSNPKWNAAWSHLTEHGVPKHIGDDGEVGDPDDEELVDRRTVDRIVEQRIAAREKEREERTQKQEREYREKALSIGKVAHEFMEELGVDRDTTKAYMGQIQEDLPVDVDPVLHYTPVDFRKELVRVHEKAQLQARIAQLEAVVNQKASKDARTTKQSQPPPRRIESRGKKSAVQLLNEQLGLADDWSNVAGWGEEG